MPLRIDVPEKFLNLFHKIFEKIELVLIENIE